MATVDPDEQCSCGHDRNAHANRRGRCHTSVYFAVTHDDRPCTCIVFSPRMERTITPSDITRVTTTAIHAVADVKDAEIARLRQEVRAMADLREVNATRRSSASSTARAKTTTRTPGCRWALTPSATSAGGHMSTVEREIRCKLCGDPIRFIPGTRAMASRWEHVERVLRHAPQPPAVVAIPKAEAARDALFALEEMLGALSDPRRARVYEWRSRLNDLFYELRAEAENNGDR
jgi:hypothetical protein